ncbi:hypothetical protein ACIHAX_16870 [Nocardia sp. NPDC051929]|uniref:hypothetical protein n=1 Tax=unclassified Nocardia TaxID=2637762 RepID=UPI0034380EE4
MMVVGGAALALSACATSIPDPQAGTATTTQLLSGTDAPPGDEAPGRPGKTDAGKAAGAPFRIPAFTELQGAPIVAVKELAVQRIAAACGGCASVAVAQDKADTYRSICQYSGFSGAKQDSTPTGESVNGSLILMSGSTLTLLTGTLSPQKLPCGTEGFEPKTSDTTSPTRTVSPTGADSTTRTQTPTETATSKPRVTTTR